MSERWEDDYDYQEERREAERERRIERLRQLSRTAPPEQAADAYCALGDLLDDLGPRCPECGEVTDADTDLCEVCGLGGCCCTCPAEQGEEE